MVHPAVRNNTIDLLRFLSISAVILIHTTTRHLEIVNFVLPAHQFTLFLNQVSRFAVPLFFLISGYVLELNYRPGYGQYLKKRFSRILLPYVLWSAFYYYFIYTKHSQNFLSALITGDSSYQLYFIPSLLISYLFFPLLRRLWHVRYSSPVLFVLFICQLLLLNADYRLVFPALPYPLSVALFNFFPFLFGIYLSRHPVLPVRRWYDNFWLLGVISAGIYLIFREGYQGYQKTFNIHYFYSQWRPSVLIYTLAVFHFFNTLPAAVICKIPYISALSRLSFFVFFIHILVLEFVWKYLGIYIYQYPLFDLFYFSVVLSVSFGLAYVFHHLFRLNKLTG